MHGILGGNIDNIDDRSDGERVTWRNISKRRPTVAPCTPTAASSCSGMKHDRSQTKQSVHHGTTRILNDDSGQCCALVSVADPIVIFRVERNNARDPRRVRITPSFVNLTFDVVEEQDVTVHQLIFREACKTHHARRILADNAKQVVQVLLLKLSDFHISHHQSARCRAEHM